MSCLSDGDPKSPILLVGMSPGNEEVIQNRPFVGGSGRLLWGLAKRAGWDRSQCFIVNCIGEFPTGLGGNPSKEQLERYWEPFQELVAASQARVVVCLGGVAFKRLTGIAGGIESWRGYLVSKEECQPVERTVITHTVYKSNTKKAKKGDPRAVRSRVVEAPCLPPNVQWIVPTLHPAGVMRSGFTTVPALAADLKRVKRVLDNALRDSRTSFVEYPVIHSDDGPIAVDIETSYVSGAIERIALAHELDTYSVAWGSGVSSAVVATLRNAGVKVAHNVAFDVPRLVDAGVKIDGPLFDTMLAAAMLQPDLYKSLNSVASLYLDRQRWKHLSSENPALYNANDASATLELYHVLKADLERTQQLRLFTDTIMPTVSVLIDMSSYGIRLDEVHRGTWIAALQKEQTSLQSRWYERVGNVNPASHQQVRRLIYSDWGLEEQYDRYGKVTTNEGALRTLLSTVSTEQRGQLHGGLGDGDRRSALDCLLKLRGITKDLDTYAETPVGADGCIHPSYLPATKDDERKDFDGDVVGKGLAGTWRISAKNPNIQNQTPAARLMYVPHEPGMVLIEADYSQIEARITATLSGDAALKDAIRSGLHETNATRLGVDKTRAKNGFYGWSYRAGAPTLFKTFRAKGYNIPLSDCQQLLNGFNRLFPAASRYMDSLVTLANQQYYIQNPFGLRRYFYAKGQGPAAANFIPQSTAAIIMWRILKILHAALSPIGGTLLATIHDSVLIEVPQEKQYVAMQILRAVMEMEFPEVGPGFRVPINIKSGKSWGNMEAVSEQNQAI